MNIPIQTPGIDKICSQEHRVYLLNQTINSGIVPAKPNYFAYNRCLNRKPDSYSWLTWGEYCACNYLEERPLFSCLSIILRDVIAV